jgi:hypothetical protein
VGRGRGEYREEREGEEREAVREKEQTKQEGSREGRERRRREGRRKGRRREREGVKEREREKKELASPIFQEYINNIDQVVECVVLDVEQKNNYIHLSLRDSVVQSVKEGKPFKGIYFSVPIPTFPKFRVFRPFPLPPSVPLLPPSFCSPSTFHSAFSIRPPAFPSLSVPPPSTYSLFSDTPYPGNLSHRIRTELRQKRSLG